MKRRVLAILCVLSILMGMVVMPAAAETTATAQSDVSDTYKVGYAKVDVSPIASDGTVIQVPMSGYSNSRKRLATSIDEHIYSTCTAITDAEGNTVLYYTLDCISPPNNLVKDVRAAVVEALGDQGITADRIYINGSHSHEAPDFGTVKNAKVYYDGKDSNDSYNKNTTTYMAEVTEGLGLTESITEAAYVELITQWSDYYSTVITNMKQAAVDALADAVPCYMTKGQIDASDYTATITSDSKYAAFAGKPMNAVRHYKLTLTKTTTQQTRSTILSSWEDGTSTTEVVSVNYRGDNFGSAVTKPDTSYSNTAWNATSREMYTYTLTEENVNEADDNIYLIQFKPTDGSAPIVFANWRGHPSINGGATVTEVSSDYIDHFRNTLEAAGLRPAFFLGASGNINTHNKLDTWRDSYDDGDARTQAYGEMLGQIALSGLTNNMSENLDCGTIRTLQSTYTNTYNTPTLGLYEVAKAAMADEDATYPYPGTGSDGVSYTVDTWYNANNIVNKYNNKKATYSEEINTILLGDKVAFVTSPNELFDYYNENMETGADANKWLELNSEDTYGTPFIMAYTNGHNSYLPNKLAYAYENASGSTGSYESYASYYAAGGGEALLEQYGKMLGMLSTDSVIYKCQHCQEEVEWTPLFAGDANGDLTSGHYFMVEDLVGSDQNGQQKIGAEIKNEEDKVIGYTTEDVCLDLNGHVYSSESRCAIVYKGSTLNIMNMIGVDGDGNAVENKYSGITGKMIGMTNKNNPGGGAFVVNSGATVNLYGGTLEFQQRDKSTYGAEYNTGFGAVFSLSGTLNMFGGTIHGSDFGTVYPYSSSGSYIGLGGAIYIAGSGLLDMRDGSITSGSVPESGAGPCVYLAGTASKVKLSGDASIEDIYYRYSSGTAVTISGTYTGTTNLTFNDSSDTTFTDSITLTQNLDIGNVESGADISGDKLTCSNIKADGVNWQVRTLGTNLVLYGYNDTTQAVIVNGSDETEYTSLANAISNYTSNGSNYIKLIQAPTDTAVAVSKETYLDLNGLDVSAAIAVEEGYTLYVMDSMTDDYNIDDSYGYGKLTGTLNGTVEGVPVDATVAVDGYLKVTEDTGVSFHRVNLQLSTINLRAQSTDGTSYDPGMYYSVEEGFSADSVVAALINSSADNYYGVAMLADDGDTSNGKEIPSRETLKDDNHSKYATFKAGKAQNTANGTLLSGILKETNNVLINRRNANITVYGSAYIKIGDQYMFGPCVEQSLRNLFVGTTVVIGGVEKPITPINNRAFLDALNDTQWECVLGLYEKYQSMIDAWITESGETNHFQAILNDVEYNALKILVVGNSHGLDATNLLYEVFEAQKNSEGKYVTADGREYNDIVIGNLYYSGCRIEQHADWINDDPHYSYSKIDSSVGTGVKWQNTTYNTSMNTALEDEPWDIIVMQTMNSNSALDSGFNAADFKTVINHINNTVKYDNGSLVNPKFAWHMVWSNPDASEGNGYFESNYISDTYPTTNWVSNHNTWFPGTDGNYDQSVMYDELVRCLKEYIVDDETFLGSSVFDYILPSAVAVEYAQDVLGLEQVDVYRDYTHMNDYGRLMVAYTWWAELMGYDSIGVDIIGEIPSALHHSNSTILETNAAGNFVVTDDLKRIITRSVNYALEMNDPSLDNAYQIEEDNTISILGIGNSYTIDSMWMLGEVYEAENPGKTVQLGIAYKSGQSLSGHVSDYESAVYDYFYWDSDSQTWTVNNGMTTKMSLEDIIGAQTWEMVSLQQSSASSGKSTTYNSDIQTIQAKVEAKLGYAPTYLWNMTWAHPATSTNTYYVENGVFSQKVMYNAIIDAVQKKIVPDATFEYLMPVGTAVQNANATLTDTDLYRDNTHVNGLGRLIAAYTWYCELETVTLDQISMTALPEITYTATGTWYNSTDEEPTAAQIALIAEAVKAARQSNFTTTDDFVD